MNYLLKESVEFDDRGYKSFRACGTKWLAHKIGALVIYLDIFAIFIIHIQSIAEDHSYRSRD